MSSFDWLDELATSTIGAIISSASSGYSSRISCGTSNSVNWGVTVAVAFGSIVTVGCTGSTNRLLLVCSTLSVIGNLVRFINVSSVSVAWNGVTRIGDSEGGDAGGGEGAGEGCEGTGDGEIFSTGGEDWNDTGDGDFLTGGCGWDGTGEGEFISTGGEGVGLCCLDLPNLHFFLDFCFWPDEVCTRK